MRKHFLQLLALVAMALPIAPAWADKFSDTIDVFKKAGQSGAYFDKSYGYAVFPTIGKAGVGVGGAYGDGRVYAKGKHVGNTSMTQVSIGAQLGGEAYSQIIFFEDERAFKEFTGGKFEFGAEATAVVITAAASAKGATTGSSAGASGGKHDAKTAGKYHKGMATFAVVKGGLMADASVSGQKFKYKPI